MDAARPRLLWGGSVLLVSLSETGGGPCDPRFEVHAPPASLLHWCGRCTIWVGCFIVIAALGVALAYGARQTYLRRREVGLSRDQAKNDPERDRREARRGG